MGRKECPKEEGIRAFRFGHFVFGEEQISLADIYYWKDSEEYKEGNNMDYNYNGRRAFLRSSYASVQGTIVELVPMKIGNRRADGCMIFATVEDADGNTVNFVISPATFVVDYTTLSVGMLCTFWYRTDAPVPLIYPPQYNAAVIAEEQNGRMIDVGYYNNSLVNEAQTLQLNMDGSVDLRTTNNQYFQGNPANHNLVVIYETSTRSIPAQTTPRKVVVLCDMGQGM